METRAEFKYIRIPDRKVRIVLNLIKGKKVDIAFNILKFTNKRAAEVVRKLLRSAVSNISAKQGVNIENLHIVKAYANQGPMYNKKLHARAMLRRGLIKRKSCHVTIVVSDEKIETKVIKETKVSKVTKENKEKEVTKETKVSKEIKEIKEKKATKDGGS
ncbi:MAG: 50S ribosomal protein L22 [Candidatus Firestonebacteria bacterium]